MILIEKVFTEFYRVFFVGSALKWQRFYWVSFDWEEFYRVLIQFDCLFTEMIFIEEVFTEFYRVFCCCCCGRESRNGVHLRGDVGRRGARRDAGLLAGQPHRVQLRHAEAGPGHTRGLEMGRLQVKKTNKQKKHGFPNLTQSNLT